MEIEIPRTFQAVDLWSDPMDIARQLNEASGEKALVSIVHPVDSKEVFHEDGVYEIATLMKGMNGSPYVAQIFDDRGVIKRAGFSLEGLAGVLVSCSNGDSLIIPEHPGRFQRIKINGEYSIPVNEVLGSQVGKLVLMECADNPNSFGKYFPTNVDETFENSYRATVISIKGATTGLYDYNNVRGILVAEKSLPPEFIGRPY